LTEQASLARAVMNSADARRPRDVNDARHAVRSWTEPRRNQADAARRTLMEIEASGGPWTFAKLTIANAALRELALASETKRRRK